MVVCCVPRCNAGRKPDSSITFHAFPSNPDMAARWIRNINLFIPNGGTWFPQAGNIMVCSKHFLQSDFRPELKTPTLKPRSVPTIFEKAVSPNPVLAAKSGIKRKKEEPKSPLIVKVVKPVEDPEDTEMDDTPLTELLRESLHASSSSSSFSAPSSSSSSSFTPSSNSSFCISRVTSLAGSRSLPQQSINSHIPRDPDTIETENTAVYGETDSAALHKDGPCTEGGNADKPMGEADKHRDQASSRKPKVMTTSRPKKKESTDLIEIGPSTFLKINPDVIKVTKKVTPSGNTVLQFVMNPNLGLDPKNIFQPVMNNDSLTSGPRTFPNNTLSGFDQISSSNTEKISESSSNEIENQSLSPNKTSSDALSPNFMQLVESNNVHIAPLIAPVVLSTNLPVSRAVSYSMQQKHANIMRQKNRQIQSLKAKVDKLLKKVDELETKCIVQERQLDFPSLKKLRAIKKNADKGESHANFILEQIRGYFGNNPLRWSDSTMTQCSVWCRKAPYAYEYFKKADLFRLPCLGTVKRFMKKHPEITTQIRNRTLGVHTLDSGDSSSDFDFDEDEDMPNDENSVNSANQVPCETVLTVPSNYTSEDSQAMIVPDAPLKSSEQNFAISETADFTFSDSANLVDNAENSEKSPMLNSDDSNNAPANCEECQDVVADEVVGTNVEASVADSENGQLSTEDTVKSNPDDTVKSVYFPSNQDSGITTMNLNGQEIILQPGNVIHLNSNLDGCEGIENQYFVIPAAATDDQSAGGDHQYSSVSQPLSFVIQNGGEEQVIYITEDTSSASETVAVSLTN